MKKEISITYEFFTEPTELSEEEHNLFNAAIAARKNAYAPYSEFLVGCAVLLDDGNVISGNNQENAAFPSGLCAERTAVFFCGANYPDSKIKKIFIVGGPKVSVEYTPPIPPCGACRQSLMEYETKQAENIEIFFGNLQNEIYKIPSVKSLLPFYFDATFL